MLGYTVRENAYHTHDCDECTYRGTIELVPGQDRWIDFYTCPNGPGRTYIARYGSAGLEYTSMNAMVLSDLDSIPADPILVMLWTLWAADQAKASSEG